MNLHKILLLSLISMYFISCGKDENPNTDGDPTALEEARLQTTQQISGGDTKVWRIASASLTNESGTFDISNNFNVVDDEFIFSSEESLEWRQANDINVNATTQQETLLDYYRSPLSSSFEYKEESSTEFTALNGRISLTVANENSINGTITYDGRMLGGEITITLTPKLAEDYVSAPQNGLSFTEIISFEDIDIFGEANVGIVGSYADNSLYIANRTSLSPSTTHQTRKLDIATGNFITNIFDISDFYTKRAFVVNNELIVFGGQYIYTYDLDLSSEPTIVDHGLGVYAISRFGATFYDDEIYIVGGDLEELESDHINKFNPSTGEISFVGTLPGPKTHAGAEIVNNVLYVFSGREQFIADETVSTVSYSYNLLTGATTTFNTTYPMRNTYASRYQNLIYVSGDVGIDNNGDGYIDRYDISIGVYNTLDNTFNEIEHDLDDSIPFLNIAAMTVFNNKMYVLYGEAGFGICHIMVADLN